MRPRHESLFGFDSSAPAIAGKAKRASALMSSASAAVRPTAVLRGDTGLRFFQLSCYFPSSALSDRVGEVESKALAERAPARMKGEISSAPAGGWVVSVELAVPSGNSAAVACITDANVTTIRPCAR